jgi:hypothetical protein
MDNEGLRLGMFLGGLIMAAVPVSLGLGVGIYVLRRYLHDRDPSSPRDGPS